MSKLTDSLNVCLATSFDFYARAHAMHWNYEGQLFPLYHDFFGTLYLEVYAAIDPLAEQIRAANGYAITSIKKMYDKSVLPEPKETVGNELNIMLDELNICNEVVIECLNKCFREANTANEQGLADFLSARIDAHKKHGWMIRSCIA